jgi:YfiH family protein
VTVVPHGEPAVYLSFPTLTALGLPHATTTRHCPGTATGDEPSAPFAPATAAALAATGLDLGRAAWARQVHGVDVVRVDGRGGFAGRADVLVTTERRVPLAIFTADCVPVVLYDPEGSVLAAAHVGWRGAARGAAETAVAAAVAAGARAERLVAVLGPAIGSCCYEVDGPVAAAFASRYGERWRAWARPVRPGHVMLDLGRVVEDLLVERGVARARIARAGLCTACHPELFYSYRQGHRGRIVTLAALP